METMERFLVTHFVRELAEGWSGGCMGAVGADGVGKTCAQTHTTTLYCLCVRL